MGKFRDSTKALMRQLLAGDLPRPVIDLGGRGHRGDTAECIKAEFETWDMQADRGTTRVVNAHSMKGVEDASVGTIICTSAMEHFERPWLAAAHMARVHKPGGLLFVSVPFKFNFHQCPDDYWRFTISGLRVLFGQDYIESKCDWFDPDGCYFLGRRKPIHDEAEAIKTMAGIKGLITEAEARFLYRMADSAAPGGEVVELGTYLGRSCSVLCHVAARWGKIPTTVDDYSYKMPTNPSTVGKHLRQRGLNARIIKADSRTAQPNVKSVSALFVDSLHLANHFNAEMDAWLPLVVKGGVVVCHDYEHTKWKEMKAAIDARFEGWQKLGTETSMIAFRKP